MAEQIAVAEQVLIMGSHNHEYVNIVKGKRTKRQRLSSMTAHATTATTTSSSSSSGVGAGAGGDHDGDAHDLITTHPSPITPLEFPESSEEEEDMANCLILLAQGHNRDNKQATTSSKPIFDDHEGAVAAPAAGPEKQFRSFRRISNVAAAATTTATNYSKVGLDAYECKTCNRCFPSFQALGGHRASHKRPKPMVVNNEEIKKSTAAAAISSSTTGSLMFMEEETQLIISNINETASGATTPAAKSLSFQMGLNNISSSRSSHLSNSHGHNNNKSRVHECSICGSEFSSGQALGGHMRRHRTSTSASTTTSNTNTTAVISSDQSTHHQQKSLKMALSLDLNLPAPEEDRAVLDTNKFMFTSKQRPLVFSSTSSLVDCHH